MPHTYIAYLVTSAHQYHKRLSQQGYPPDPAHFELVIFQEGTEGTIALAVRQVPLFHDQYGHTVLLIRG
jgi:hypothetical protein